MNYLAIQPSAKVKPPSTFGVRLMRAKAAFTPSPTRSFTPWTYLKN
jgi:hypothetical protein